MTFRALVDNAKNIVSGRHEAVTTADVGSVMVPVGSKIVGKPGGAREMESPKTIVVRGIPFSYPPRAPIETMIKRLHRMRDSLANGSPKGLDKAINNAISSLVKLQRQLRGS